jgi:hypothetical protein
MESLDAVILFTSGPINEAMQELQDRLEHITTDYWTGQC